MTATIRCANDQDASQVQAVYEPIVAETAISFELQPPDVVQMRRRIVDTLATYPWLVCDRGGELLGYAYACRHRLRLAYRWAVEVSVYVKDGNRRCGIGRALYSALFAILTDQGFCNAYAGLTLPNPPSVSLHEALGFQPVGVYRRIGFKLGAWHDVGWWQLSLAPYGNPPEPPHTFAALRITTGWEDIFVDAAGRIRV